MMQTTEVLPSSMSFNYDPITTNPNPNNHPPLPPSKKKRNLPGNPDPEADVISLSPRTLMATNRFVCGICSKGFQRDQNLQLHRRGHNLPWKLKQRSTKEVKKKVYVCPEKNCVHHDPSRALGDLTGIKKHFSRKHGEKRWKCEKCSKKYAVKSDWKAHSKTCGTREYRCDCGTIFSRRDSFITHRAFCDALTEENMRLAPPITDAGAADSSGDGNDQMALTDILMQKYRDEDRNQKEVDLSVWLATNSGYFNHIMNVPATTTGVDLLAAGSGSIGGLIPEMFHTKERFESPMYNSSSNSNSLMSATALLQKAARMGTAAVSSPSSSTFVGLGRQMGPIGTPQPHKNMEGIPNCYNHDSSTNHVSPMQIPMSIGEIPKFPIPLKLNHHGVGGSLTRDFLGLGGEESSCRPLSTQELARLTSMGNVMDSIRNGTYNVMWSGDLA